ncbi:MAG: hypothetical protein KC496_13825 [Anaerolineae bacterium]|nr:hypothetical protein [Anaerolineae bacterium]
MNTVLFEAYNYQMGWYDEQQTILYLDVFAPWTWNEMYLLVGDMLGILGNTHYDFYTVQWFHDGGERLPNGITLPHVKRIMTINYPHEQLLIMAGVPRWKPYMEIASRAMRIAGMQDADKFRFVDTVQEALALVEEHKSNCMRSR